MRTKLRLTVCIVALLVTTPAWSQTVLRIQDYPGLGNFLVRVANANGLCEKHGVKCDLRIIPQASLGLQALLARDIEVAHAPPEVLIQATSKGADLKVVGSSLRMPPFFLIASTSLATPNAVKGYPAVMQDFKGKRIGIAARGTATEFQLIDFLKGAGLKAEDVTLLAVGAPNTALPAITNGQIDGLMLYSPMDGFCEVNNVCRVVVDPRKGEGPADVLNTAGAAVVFVVRGDFAVKNSAALDGFSRAMREAEALLKNPANFAAMLKVAQDTFKITTPNGDQVLAISLRNNLPTYGFELDPKAMQHIAEYMHRTGQIDKLVDTGKLLLSKP